MGECLALNNYNDFRDVNKRQKKLFFAYQFDVVNMVYSILRKKKNTSSED